jgi:hypothetical protein
MLRVGWDVVRREYLANKGREFCLAPAGGRAFPGHQVEQLGEVSRQER